MLVTLLDGMTIADSQGEAGHVRLALAGKEAPSFSALHLAHGHYELAVFVTQSSRTV